MIRKTENVRPFEFSLRINNHIICQRFFNIKNYNNDCRESYELKEMLDEIMSTNQQLKLGLIPEYFKYRCVANSHKPYHLQNNTLSDKKVIFSLEISKNNVNKLREGGNNFNIEDLEKEVICVGSFDGNLFHPNVRYDVDIRSIIPDIIKVISKYMSFKNNTNTFGDVKLTRLNKLTQDELEKTYQN
jgi:hypothetical protein